MYSSKNELDASFRKITPLFHRYVGICTLENYYHALFLSKFTLGYGTVRYLAAVCHGEQTGLQMFEMEVLVRKGGARIDGHAPCPVTVHKISS
jgi:hypothetical protein